MCRTTIVKVRSLKMLFDQINYPKNHVNIITCQNYTDAKDFIIHCKCILTLTLKYSYTIWCLILINRSSIWPKSALSWWDRVWWEDGARVQHIQGDKHIVIIGCGYGGKDLALWLWWRPTRRWQSSTPRTLFYHNVASVRDCCRRK